MADADKGLAKDKGHGQDRPSRNPHRTKLQDGKDQSAPLPSVPTSKIQTARNRQQDQRRTDRPGDTSRYAVVPPSTQPVPDLVIAGKYRLLSRIGQGSFGELYRAEGKFGDLVAVKVERSAVRHPLLEREARIYGILEGGRGIPRMRYYGIEGEFNVMVLDLLGPTLEDLLNLCQRTFSMKTVLLLADQILDRIEFLHVKCFVHRDIKPDNFLIGRGRHSSLVYIIDFGLAKKFYSKSSQQHINYTENKDLVGTARYASIRAHYAEQGRRDDLESVGYLLLYFRRGRLPWQGLQAETEAQKYERIAESKASVPLDSLCTGLPMEFLLYLQYCRNLHFQQKPDYHFLRELFKTVFRNQYKRFDLRYDWELKRQKPAQLIKEGGDPRVQGTCNGDTDRARNRKVDPRVQGTRNGDTDRARNRKVDTARKDLTERRNQDREPERNLATDRAGARNRELGRAGYTQRERGRERDRDQDRGTERCREGGRQDCSCSYHQQMRRLRGRQPGEATELRKNVPEEPPSSRRQTPSSRRQPPPGF